MSHNNKVHCYEVFTYGMKKKSFTSVRNNFWSFLKKEKKIFINGKNIGRNPIVDCERNGERIENNRIENEMRVQLENGNKSPFTNWKYNSN